ncbi:MAG TPA: histidine kinase [Terrimicrobiaceae bacterium]
MTSAHAIKETMDPEDSRALHALLNASQTALIEVGGTKQITNWSPAAQRIFGWAGPEIIGRKISLLAADKELEGFLASASDSEISRRELSCRHNEGTLVRVDICACHIQPGDRRMLLAIRDATEAAFLEHAFLDAADREQRRLAREMHDHLCQHILGAAFAVKALAGELDREGSRHAVQLHDLARLVNETVTHIRNISRSLHPLQLESGGLRSAIQGLCDRFANRLSCEFHCSANLALLHAVAALHAYRITQEAVLHALDHTGANKVTIHLSAKGGTLHLRIWDNGEREGPATANLDHIASKTLRYRAKAISAQLSLEFSSGAGTTISCTFPQTS